MKIPTSVIVEEINDKHMAPWAEICLRDKTENTPLTPFMDGELIQHCHLNLSNEKLKATGYRLKVPLLTQENIEEVHWNIAIKFKVKSTYAIENIYYYFLSLLDRQ